MIRLNKETRVKWQNLVSEQEQCEQSVTAFCRARELPPSKFYYWKKKVREGKQPFVEVQVAKAHASQDHSGSSVGPTIEVRLSNGRSLMVGPDFDASHLRALLAIVES